MPGVSKSEPLTGSRRSCDLLIATIVVAVIAAPMLFTNSGFAIDFTNHLWLTWAAGNSLVQAGHPSYFLNASGLGVGVFYPWFAFYGGTLYMTVGGISELSGGHPILAYVGVTTLAIAGSYLGMVWLGHELGLRGLASHAPALAVVTSAFYVTNLYGRGAWPEFMAAAAIAPLLASGVHLLRASIWRPLPILVFVVSAVIFSGSHNITLLWGTTVAAFAAILIWLALGLPRRLPIRRLAMVGGLGVASVLVNAWYLVPDIAYANDVLVHEVPAEAEVSFLDAPALIFDPLRKVPAASGTPALFVQVPVWFLAWGLVAGALLLWRRRSGGRLRGAWIGVVVLIGVLLGLFMLTPVWKLIPFPFDEIQFPYRLGSYIYYAVGGLALVSALALQQAARERRANRTVRGLRLGLAGVCAVSVGLCVWQLWVPNTLFHDYSYVNRQDALVSVNRVPRTWYDLGSYNDSEAPVVAVPSGRSLTIDPSAVHGDRFAAWMRVPPGLAPIQTNIAGGSYLVHISGLTWVGRNGYGYAVVRRERQGSGPVHVVVQSASSVTLAVSWVASIVACLAILVVLGWACARSLRARRRGRVTAAIESG